MSDELLNEPVEVLEVEVEVEEPDGAAAAFSQEVKTLVGASGPKVREQVKEQLVRRAIDERAALVIKAMDRRSALLRDLQKCRPDVRSVGSDGKKDERFSEAKWKEKTELENKLKKLDAALSSALAETPNYEPLKKVTSQCGPPSQPGCWPSGAQ